MTTLLLLIVGFGVGLVMGVTFADKIKVKVESAETEVKKDA